MDDRTAAEYLTAARESLSACSYRLLGAQIREEEFLILRDSLSDTMRGLATVGALLAAARTRADPAPVSPAAMLDAARALRAAAIVLESDGR